MSPEPAQCDDTDDEILLALFEAQERGESLTAAALLERFPGRAADVQRLMRAAARYGELARSIRPADGASLLPPGTRLGDFEIVGLLARGGMGAVYRARQHSLGGRMVALKLLAKDHCSRTAADRFRREALALSDLHHPNLAEVFGFGEQDGRLYYAMRLIEGPTLRSVLGRLTARRAAGQQLESDERRRLVTWASELAEALALVHARGLVHRDVKPGNVLIETLADGESGLPTGPAVLVDFGLVHSIDGPAQTLTGLGAGTLPYASPEQLMGQAVDARADVFSLGVTLHDLLSCRLPDQRGSAAAGLERLSALDPGCNADLQSVVAKATDPSASWRYADARGLARDLRAWLGGETVEARRIGPAERLRRSLSRNPRRWLRSAAWGAALAGLVAGLVTADRVRAKARDARTALAELDLPRLSKALDDMGPAARWAFLKGDEWAELHRHLILSTDDHACVRVTEHLNAGRREQALLSAATALRLEGLTTEPLLLELLTRALGDKESESRRTAWRLVARLLYERPDQDAGDQVASEGLRTRLLLRAADTESSTTEPLLALTALSGCATPAQLEGLFSRAQEAWGHEPELFRLGLLAAERTIRRSHRLGLLAGGPHGAAWDSMAVFLGLLSIVYDGSSGPVAYDHLMAARQLLAAMCFARRAVAAPERQPAILPVMPLSAYLDHDLGGLDEALLAAAAGEPRVGPWLRDAVQRGLDAAGSDDCPLLVPMGHDLEGVRAVGRVAGALGDDSVVKELHALVAVRPEAVADFEAGVSIGQDESRGMIKEQDLDGDTQLGAAGPSGVDVPFDRRRLGDAAPTSEFCPWELARESLGGWRALDSAVETWGWDIEVIGGSASWMRAEHETPLRLAQVERSAIQMKFVVPRSVEPAEIELHVCAVFASRAYYPWRGGAALRLLLDGEDAGTVRLVSHSADQAVAIVRFEQSKVRPGRHVLELTLDASSYGPAWVYGAWFMPKCWGTNSPAKTTR